MTTEKIQKIEKVVQDYKNKKNQLHDMEREIEKLSKVSKNFDWAKQERIHDLYSDLAESPERVEFKRMAEMAANDVEFEKYFRAAFLKSFFGILVDPLIL